MITVILGDEDRKKPYSPPRRCGWRRWIQPAAPGARIGRGDPRRHRRKHGRRAMPLAQRLHQEAGKGRRRASRGAGWTSCRTRRAASCVAPPLTQMIGNGGPIARSIPPACTTRIPACSARRRGIAMACRSDHPALGGAARSAMPSMPSATRRIDLPARSPSQKVPVCPPLVPRGQAAPTTSKVRPLPTLALSVVRQPIRATVNSLMDRPNPVPAMVRATRSSHLLEVPENARLRLRRDTD